MVAILVTFYSAMGNQKGDAMSILKKVGTFGITIQGDVRQQLAAEYHPPRLVPAGSLVDLTQGRYGHLSRRGHRPVSGSPLSVTFPLGPLFR